MDRAAFTAECFAAADEAEEKWLQAVRAFRRRKPGAVPAGLADLGRPRGDAMTSAAKQRTLELAEQHVCPDRVRFLAEAGIDLVIGRREGYRIWDVDGRELIDIHLNGGVFNLGHRNPEVIGALTEALETLDIGNHHFPSTERAALAERLVDLTPGMQYAVFASGGGEAVDLALKSARRATGSAASCRSPTPTTVTRGWRWPPATNRRRPPSSRPIPTSCGCPSTTSRRSRRHCRNRPPR